MLNRINDKRALDQKLLKDREALAAIPGGNDRLGDLSRYMRP